MAVLTQRVLLVEDNPDHQFVALSVLRQLLGEDCEVVVASTAREAIEIAAHFTAQDHPDLILVDLYLPQHGGFAVLSALRDLEFLAGVPIFVLTSSVYGRDIAMSYELGASAVLFKPLSRGQLRNELRRNGALL